MQPGNTRRLSLIVPGAVLLATLTAVALFLDTSFLRSLVAPASDRTLLPVMVEQGVRMENGADLYVQKYEVTIAEWNRCFDAGSCDLQLRSRSGKAPEEMPATGLSYLDVAQYVKWLSARTGHPFRLPTVAEWQWIAREVLPDEPDPIFTDPSLSWAADYMIENLPARQLKPKGSFPATREGIFDLSGSVWEWTQDCYVDPSGPNGCPAYYAAGEHMAVISLLIRDPARGGCAVGAPPAHLGFRVVSDRSVAAD